MNLSDVFAEMETRLRRIPKLNVPDIEAQSITPDAVLFSLPEERTYDASYGGGLEVHVIELTICVSKTAIFGAVQKLLQYTDPSGPRSIRAALNSAPGDGYSSCDEVTVQQSKFAHVEVGSVEYMAALITVHIAGSGR